MRRFGKKLVQLVLVLLVVTFFAFLLINLLPGDPAEVVIPFGSDEQRETLRNDLNLDDPLISRYFSWLGGFLTGDMGEFYNSPQSVAERLATAVPVSVQLLVYAQILALAVSIPLGILTAYRADTVFDRSTNAGAFALLAIPNFVLALLLAYFLGLRLGWFPVIGYTEFGENPFEHFRSMALPAIALAAGQVAVYTRLLRSDMIATLQQDFITMAKAKGLPPATVLMKHAFRPSSISLLTVAGLNVGVMISGAVVLEIIFNLPGIGRMIVDAILSREYIALQTLIALVGFVYVLINFVVDLAYSLIDPRIRHARAIT